MRAPGDAADCVVLLHGLGRTSRSMTKMNRALREAGFQTLNVDYDSRHKPLEDLARDVDLSIRATTKSGGLVHFVTHPMGALVLRVMLCRTNPTWLGRVVMIGPPNQGSEIADLLHSRYLFRVVFGPAGQQLTTAKCVDLGRRGPVTFEVGVVAGLKPDTLLSRMLLPTPNDGKVTVQSTCLDGMADHLTIRGAHPWLMQNEEAIRQTIAFLRNGRFSIDGAEPK